MRWVKNRLFNIAKNDPGLNNALNVALRQTPQLPLAPITTEPRLEQIPTQNKLPLAPIPTQSPELEPIPTLSQRQRKIMRWQKYYNASVKGTWLDPIRVDGILGPETRNAMKKVRDSGAKTLSEFHSIMKDWYH